MINKLYLPILFVFFNTYDAIASDTEFLSARNYLHYTIMCGNATRQDIAVVKQFKKNGFNKIEAKEKLINERFRSISDREWAIRRATLVTEFIYESRSNVRERDIDEQCERVLFGKQYIERMPDYPYFIAFKAANINSFLESISEITGNEYIFGKDVSTEVSFTLSRYINKCEAEKVLNEILRYLGFSAELTRLKHLSNEEKKNIHNIEGNIYRIIKLPVNNDISESNVQIRIDGDIKQKIRVNMEHNVNDELLEILYVEPVSKIDCKNSN